MQDNYTKIVAANLAQLFENPPSDLAARLPAIKNADSYEFRAFGGNCRLDPKGIRLDDERQTGVIGILLSLYALNSDPAVCVLDPLKAYKDFPNSMPYVGAFASHTEQILVPHVPALKKVRSQIIEPFGGQDATARVGSDFAFVLYPLPKIALCYIFYEADEDFPASVTCLFSNNADVFLPLDALADLGEYTSRKLLTLLL
jgi:hypothetical protein